MTIIPNDAICFHNHLIISYQTKPMNDNDEVRLSNYRASRRTVENSSQNIQIELSIAFPKIFGAHLMLPFFFIFFFYYLFVVYKCPPLNFIEILFFQELSKNLKYENEATWHLEGFWRVDVKLKEKSIYKEFVYHYEGLFQK